MSDRLHASLVQFGSWQRVGLLCVACAAVFAIRHLTLLHGAKLDPRDVPDARLWYTAADARDYLDLIGPDARGVYAVILLTADVLMPVLYVALLGGLIARFCTPGFGRWWVWVPVLAAAMDVGENVLLAYLCVTFDGSVAALTPLAASLTTAKWGLSAAAVFGLILGALGRAVVQRKTG